jgi:hypothetical protein
MSSTEMLAVPSSVGSLPRMFWRRKPVTSSVLNTGSVPTSSLRNAAGATTRSVYEPNARSRTGPNSGSRTMIGFCVPHLRSVNWRVLMK